MSNKKHTAGFSLVELMLVLSILVVALTIGVPAFKDMADSSKMITISRDLSSDIAIARSRALQYGTTIRFCTSTNSSSCSNNTSWATGWIIRDNNQSSDKLVRFRSAIPDGFTLTSSVAGYIDFRSTGTVAATRTWTICKVGAAGRTISLSLSGRVTTEVTAKATSC